MKIYFLGICGTAMGNVAVLMQAMGHDVSGVDVQFYPPISDLLKKRGIRTYQGFSEENIISERPDLIVVGNSVSRKNPEVEFLLRNRTYATTSLPALLSDFLLKERTNIVVAGTHGKTTTTTLAAFLIKKNGFDPGYLIGGIPKMLDTGVALGKKTDPFVIEGDEYDSAFFDKRSKFIHYRPHILCINNIEFDHADIFFDLRDVLRSFSHVQRLVPDNGFILINNDDCHTRELPEVLWTTTYRIGTTPECDLQICNFFEENPKYSSFELYWRGQLWQKISWPMTGLFNARNAAMAALSAALSVYPENPQKFDLSALKHFCGVRRRQEVLFEDENQLIIEDFGHHPTAIRETLLALRKRYPGFSLTACFEPRSNTARTDCLSKEFTTALSSADCIYLGPVYKGERLKSPLDISSIVDSLKGQGKEVYAFTSNKELLEALPPSREKTITIFFSNGSFDNIQHAYTAHQASLSNHPATTN